MLVGSNLIVYNPTPEVRKFCKDNLVVDNPEYISRQRMGKFLGCTPKSLYLYEERHGNLIIPYGCKNKISAFGIEKIWDIYPKLSEFKVDYKSNIQLYDYQNDAVNEMIKSINGIVVMPCGAGKTIAALECVARLGLRTLWLTHTQDLLNQSMERAKLKFDCEPDMFGTITSGKINISKGITFATVQTMCKIDLDKYRDNWAVVVVDECQHAVGSPTKLSQFYRVINNLYAPYKFGLTATPNRSDGLEQSMYALLGDKITEVSRDCVSGRTCPVVVKHIETKYFPDSDDVLDGDGTINYTKLANDLTCDSDRMKIVFDTILNLETPMMVLANRVDYLRILCESVKAKGIKAVCLSAIGTSKKARQERKDALHKLNSGELDCIFATYQLAAEGLDCPNLRCVVFATPEKNERTVTQALGRVARKADGKKYGTVIDFVDGFGMYKGWAKKRDNLYKRLGCELR